MKITETKTTAPKIKLGDVVQFEKGVGLLVEQNNVNFPVSVIDLANNKLVNSYKDLDYLNVRGCTVMGMIKTVYPRAELFLGGRN